MPYSPNPVVEMIVDIDCDFPSTILLAEMEEAISVKLKPNYPIVRRRMVQRHQVKTHQDKAPEIKVSGALQALQLVSKDEKQLIQFRENGFSFNRLAPYTSFDEYLPEIHDSWLSFSEIMSPSKIRKLGIRFINRILLPIEGNGGINLDRYLKTRPKLPRNCNLGFSTFVEQFSAITEDIHKHYVNVTIAARAVEENKIPLVVDIDVFNPDYSDSLSWDEINNQLALFRSLRNNVFNNIVTEECKKLF
jgi:uncharacterized protein (TIGR04255 family)